MLLLILLWCSVLVLAGKSPEDSSTSISRIPQRFKFDIKKDDVFFDTLLIPEDHQVKAFLYKGHKRLFFFLNDRESSSLFIRVTPCTSNIEWSVIFRPQNVTGQDSVINNNVEVSETFYGESFYVKEAKIGLYTVSVLPLDRETYVYFYLTRSQLFNDGLTDSNIKVKIRKEEKKLSLTWDESVIDPHIMKYCLVINTQKEYQSLCAAYGDRDGVIPPDYPQSGYDYPNDKQEFHKSDLAKKAVNRRHVNSPGKNSNSDFVIECVGSKTHYSLKGLQYGKVYYINLFAINTKTSLTFHYGSTSIKYDKKLTESIGLKDGEIEIVKLRQRGGSASFKFKVGRNVETTKFYVIPCGGSVYAEVFFARNVIIKRIRVEGIGILRIKNPKLGRYVLRITSVNPEELRYAKSLQVVATSKKDSKFPELPSLPKVNIYLNARTCDSFNIGWLSSPDPTVSNYCLRIYEESRGNKAFYKKPDQCGVLYGTNFKNKSNLIASYCMEIPYNTTSLNIKKISKLRPGRKYTVQLTVKKPRGYYLSYDLEQIVTKKVCLPKYNLKN